MRLQVEGYEVFRSCLARPLQAYLVAEAGPGSLRWDFPLGAEQRGLVEERRSDLQGTTLRGSTLVSAAAALGAAAAAAAAAAAVEREPPLLVRMRTKPAKFESLDRSSTRRSTPTSKTTACGKTISSPK